MGYKNYKVSLFKLLYIMILSLRHEMIILNIFELKFLKQQVIAFDQKQEQKLSMRASLNALSKSEVLQHIVAFCDLFIKLILGKFYKD